MGADTCATSVCAGSDASATLSPAEALPPRYVGDDATLRCDESLSDHRSDCNDLDACTEDDLSTFGDCKCAQVTCSDTDACTEARRVRGDRSDRPAATGRAA